MAVVQAWEDEETQPPQHVARSLDVIWSYSRGSPPDTTGARAGWAKPPKRAPGLLKSKLLDGLPTVSETPTATPPGLIRSRQRVADHGEVFTPPWLVEKMLDLVNGESERIDARFLEPACGSGNFLVPILQRKLAAVELNYGKSDFERRHYALVALSCCYGIELLADNISECRANMLDVFASYLKLDETDDLYRAAAHMLSLNLIHGDAMTMRDNDGEPILVVEWGYLGKGKFQRRDFRLDKLTGMAAFREEGTLFAGLGRHEIFQPTPDRYVPMTIGELAAQEPETVT